LDFNSSFRKYLGIFMAISGILFIWGFSSYGAEKTAKSSYDWFQWRGPNRDGISIEKGWLTEWPQGGPKKLWTIQAGTGYSTVSVSNGRVFILGNKDNKDTVYCLNSDTGKVLWKHSYPCKAEGNGHPGAASSPTVDGHKVYTLSREGHLFCLSTESGKVIWSKDIKQLGAKVPEWGFSSSPLIMDNMMFIDAGIALALDKNNGDLIWKTKDYGVAHGIKNPGGGYSSPVLFTLNGTKKLAIFNSSGLVIFNPKDGKELMLHPWKTSYNVNAATPVVSGDKIFISSGYGVGGALIQVSGAKPNVIWENKNMKNHFASCILWQGNLYGFDDSNLKCLDWQSGSEKWVQKGLGKGSLMMADGKLIILGEKGDLVIAEASPVAFKELARAKVLDGLCWTVPVLSNGKLYCKNHEGELICLDVKGK